MHHPSKRNVICMLHTLDGSELRWYIPSAIRRSAFVRKSLQRMLQCAGGRGKVCHGLYAAAAAARCTRCHMPNMAAVDAHTHVCMHDCYHPSCCTAVTCVMHVHMGVCHACAHGCLSCMCIWVSVMHVLLVTHVGPHSAAVLLACRCDL